MSIKTVIGGGLSLALIAIPAIDQNFPLSLLGLNFFLGVIVAYLDFNDRVHGKTLYGYVVLVIGVGTLLPSHIAGHIPVFAHLVNLLGFVWLLTILCRKLFGGGEH